MTSKRHTCLPLISFATALVLLWILTLIFESRAIPLNVDQFVLNSDAYAWWRLVSIYFVVNWTITALLVAPVFLAIAGLVCGASWARSLLTACVIAWLLTRCTSTLSHLLLWTVGFDARSSVSMWMRIETSLAAISLLLGLVVLYLGYKMRDAPNSNQIQNLGHAKMDRIEVVQPIGEE